MSDLLKVKVGGSSYLCKWEEPNSVIIGGRKYKTVKIGSQIWLAENLDWNFDGNAVYYNNNSTTYGPDGYDFGLLYKGTTIGTLNSLLTDGWRVPTRSDYNALLTAVGNQVSKLKSTAMWTNPGTDEINWNGEPAGYYNLFSGYVSAYGSPNGQALGMFYATSETTGSDIYVEYCEDSDSTFKSFAYWNDYRFSIRLVKDAT